MWKAYLLNSMWGGKYYATTFQIDRLNPTAEPKFAIAGPFDREDQAETWHQEHREVAIDDRAIPPDVREGITASLLRAWRAGDFSKPMGSIIGAPIH